MSIRRGARLALILQFSILLAGQNRNGSNRTTFSQPFALPTNGIGPNPIQNALIISAADELPVISRVLLDSFQNLQFSVADKGPDLAAPLTPNHTYKTDRVPISRDQVAAYNHAFPNLRLDESVLYSLQYSFKFQVQVNHDERIFFIEMDPELYERGAATPAWHASNRSYAGSFFTDELKKRLAASFGRAGGR